MKNTLYRALRGEEWDNKRLFAKGSMLFEQEPQSLIKSVYFGMPYPNAFQTVQHHIYQDGNTVGISTTENKDVAYRYCFGKNDRNIGYLAVIDRTKLKNYAVREYTGKVGDEEIILSLWPGLYYIQRCFFPKEIIMKFIKIKKPNKC